MYRLAFPNFLLLACLALSRARTISVSQNGEEASSSSSPEPDVCMTRACVMAAAGILKSLDETVDPCNDFYSFACGGWMKKTDIPEDNKENSIILVTQNKLNRKLRDLLESKYESSDLPYVRSMKNFYSTCLNVEIQGSEPLKKILRHLGGWPVVEGSQWDESSFDWVDTLISLRKLGYKHEALLDFSVNPFDQDIINLQEPSRVRYLRLVNLRLGLNDPKIAAYYRMMVKSAKLLGAEESIAQSEMLKALQFEMALINITVRDYKKDNSFAYARRIKTMSTVAKLQEELPQVPWLKIINGLLLNYEVGENQTIKIGNLDFLATFADKITSAEKRVIANYMLWRLVLESKDFLSEEWRNIDEDDEEEESPKKSRIPEEPRWNECLSKLEEKMEIGLSSYYVRRYLSEDTKKEVIIIMKYIHKEFLKIMEETDWMDKPTKIKAEKKANAIKTYIGYPQELLNDTFMMNIYENLTINNDTYLESTLSYRKWIKDKKFSRFKQSYEGPSRSYDTYKYEAITKVKAFYSPSFNSIAIPAGILHDKFYDKKRPNYMNFGAIGHIIGHEITHGFDNIGRRFDADGNRVDWWDWQSDKHFLEKTKCIIDQYNNYTTDVGLKVNGELTQGENIADNGGLKEAYLAYQSWTKDNEIEPLLPGLKYSQNQLFWISSAALYCSKYHPERLKEKLISDPHSPPKFRIIGSMSNIPEFSKDFKCSSDAPMNRKIKCKVW